VAFRHRCRRQNCRSQGYYADATAEGVGQEPKPPRTRRHVGRGDFIFGLPFDLPQRLFVWSVAMRSQWGGGPNR